MTPFHIQRKYDVDDNQNNVIDLWGKRWSGIRDSDLERPFAVPWGVLVSRVDIEAYAEESGKSDEHTLQTNFHPIELTLTLRLLYSERKTLDHVLNLPKFPRTRYKTHITMPQQGYPPQPFTFRERFITNVSPAAEILFSLFMALI